MIDRRLPRSLEPPGSVGCALALAMLVVAVFVLLLSFVMSDVSATGMVSTLTSLSHRMTSIGGGGDGTRPPFWTPKQLQVLQAAAAFKDEDDTNLELYERTAELEAVATSLDDLLVDVDKQTMVDAETLAEINARLSSPLTKIFVLEKEGRSYKADRPLISARSATLSVLQTLLGPSGIFFCREDAKIGRLLFDHAMYRAAVPELWIDADDLLELELDLDPDVANPVRPSDEARLRDQYAFTTEEMERLQALASSKKRACVEQKARRYFLTIYAVPRCQRRRLMTSMSIIDLGENMRAAAMRLKFRPDASELLAECVITRVLDRMFILFKEADRGTPYESIDNDDPRWVFAWALERRQSAHDGTDEVFLVLGKRPIDDRTREHFRLLRKEAEKRASALLEGPRQNVTTPVVEEPRSQQ